MRLSEEEKHDLDCLVDIVCANDGGYRFTDLRKIMSEEESHPEKLAYARKIINLGVAVGFIYGKPLEGELKKRYHVSQDLEGALENYKKNF